MRDLASLEFAAAKSLREVLQQKSNLEICLRSETLLKNLEEPNTLPRVLTSWRAVIVLQQIDAAAPHDLFGTSAARVLLRTLANGAPEARLTQLAQAALKRT